MDQKNDSKTKVIQICKYLKINYNTEKPENWRIEKASKISPDNKRKRIKSKILKPESH